MAFQNSFVQIQFTDNGIEILSCTTKSSVHEVFEKTEGQSWGNVATPALARLSDLVWEECSDLVWEECHEREGGGLPK